MSQIKFNLKFIKTKGLLVEQTKISITFRILFMDFCTVTDLAIRENGSIQPGQDLLISMR